MDYTIVFGGIIFGAMIGATAALASKWRVRNVPAPTKESPRPDTIATRQWVEDVVNAKTSTCLQVGGKTIEGLRAEVHALRQDLYDLKPYVYEVQYGTSSSGTKLGRLAETKNRNCWLFVSEPCAWEDGKPRPMTDDERREYNNWVEDAKDLFDSGEAMVSAESCAAGGIKEFDVHDVDAVVADLAAIGIEAKIRK